MSRVRFLLGIAATLIVIGLLVAGGVAIYRTGWRQGYSMAQLLGYGEDAAGTPNPSFGFGHPGWHVGSPFLRGGAGPILRVGVLFGLLFFTFIVFVKLFRLLTWKMVWGIAGGRWARHWHRRGGPVPPHGSVSSRGPVASHGPMPPWCWDWGKPSEEKAQPDGGIDDAGAEG